VRAKKKRMAKTEKTAVTRKSSRSVEASWFLMRWRLKSFMGKGASWGWRVMDWREIKALLAG